jgi:thiamine-phosphate pyrophosphorylase
MTREAPPGRRRPWVGVISDRRRLCAAAGRPLGDAAALLEAQVAGAAAGGATFFQLREGDLDGADLLALVRRLHGIAGERLALFVNDRADVAAAAGAGVHLKAASVPAARLQAWLPPGTAVSRAVHSVADLDVAGPVAFVIAGTAAPSRSKAAGAPVLGAGGLAAIVAASPVPVVAIGGLTPADWRWVAAAGASGCAGIGAFLPRAGEPVHAAVQRAVAAFHSAVD